MPVHRETRVVPFTAAQMHALVADVAAYPQFLPWITDTKVRPLHIGAFEADVTVGYGLLSMMYTSCVTLTPPHEIRTRSHSSTLKHLENRWSFEDIGLQQCQIKFFIDFDFAQPLFQHALNSVFSQVSQAMVRAFENRAKTVYSQTLF